LGSDVGRPAAENSRARATLSLGYCVMSHAFSLVSVCPQINKLAARAGNFDILGTSPITIHSLG